MNFLLLRQSLHAEVTTACDVSRSAVFLNNSIVKWKIKNE